MSERQLPTDRLRDLPKMQDEIVGLQNAAARPSSDSFNPDFAIAVSNVTFTTPVALPEFDLPFYALDGLVLRLEFAVKVSSTIADGLFHVDLYLDGTLLDRFDFRGSVEAASGISASDFYLDSFDEGEHTASLQIGRAGTVGGSYTLLASTAQCVLAVSEFSGG